MYKLLLILKYLRRKLAPLFAAVAVMLCTAMVIIVMSVMGGFLDQFRESARNLTGDVIVEGRIQGFADYQQLLDRLTALPEISRGTPVIETYGLINFNDNAYPVRVQGVDLSQFDEIVGYSHTLLWKPEQIVDNLGRIYSDDNPRLAELTTQISRPHPVDPDTLEDPAARGTGLPEAVIGVEVNPYQSRGEDGQYAADQAWAGARIVLTVVPMTEGGAIGTQREERGEFLVVNEFKSGLYDIDGQYVFVPFTTLQRMLTMHERRGFDKTGFNEQTGEGGREIVIPGRTNRLVLKAAPGVPVAAARDAVQGEIAKFYLETGKLSAPPQALTWEDVHGHILGAVQNEKGLVTFLFAIIGIVAVVMVATTFYMIVLEKTRDIGVLRALGASRFGIVQMFLGYGLAVGLVGSLLGLGIAVAVVVYLNEIQELIAATTGWRMWNPETYFFDRIPNQINPVEVTWVVIGSIVSSVLGATLPAVLAGRLKPVDALRYE